MPSADALLLPLCVGIALLGVIVIVVGARRGNKGRVVQGVALALAPVALYFSGLLGLLWRGVSAVGQWATTVALSPVVWAGLGLLAVCLVLWVVGGIVARRTPKRDRRAARAGTASGAAGGATGRSALPTPSRGRGTSAAPATRGRAAPEAAADDDMAEIEALLKSRGIE